MEAWQKPETFAIWLAIMLAVVFLLSAAIILINRLYLKRLLFEEQKAAEAKLNYQKKLLSDSIRIQERERERIAADLHDELISKLNVVRMLMHVDKEMQSVDPGKMLEDSITLARNISHDLMPPMLADTPLEELFRSFLLPLQHEFQVSFSLSGKSIQSCTDEMKLQLIRVYQEVINNTIKYAEASELQVCLRSSRETLSFLVRDNGKGFDLNKGKRGLGLQNIELRIQSLNGNYKFKSAKGKGTSFLCTIPIEENGKHY